MAAEVIVAIIASLTSLCMALISLVGSRRTSKKIESLKFHIGILNKRIRAIDELIENIQKLKDDLQIILNSPGDTYDSAAALEHIEIDRIHAFECYERNMACLDPNDAETAHKAKNFALVVENFLKDKLAGLKHVSGLSEKDREEILNKRTELTDLQNRLRDSKSANLFYKL